MPDLFRDEALFNAIELGGVVSPGQVTLSGHDRNIEWDIKNAAGQKGATTTYKGEKPAEFTATFYLVQDLSSGIDDFAEWDYFAQLIMSTVNGKSPKALDVYHPDLAANGISSVVLQSMGGFTYDGKGGRTIAVKFLEYKPPQKKSGTPKGAKKQADKKVDPDQAALDELAKLTKQYEDIKWK